MLEPEMTQRLISVNVAIAIANSFVCWQLWQWRGRLRRLNHQLITLEQDAHLVLTQANSAIAQPGQMSEDWRSRYLTWQCRLHQIQQLLQLLIWVDRLTRPRSR